MTTTTSFTTTTKLTTTTTITTKRPITTFNDTIPGPADGDLSNFDKFDEATIYSSVVKPIMSLSRIELSLEEAKNNPVQNVQLSINGADGKYSTIGIHITFDEQLTLDNINSVTSGDALDNFYNLTSGGMVALNKTADDHTLFLSTVGVENYGTDGVMLNIPLKIPSDCKPGYIYSVKIIYESNGIVNDMFTGAYDKNSDNITNELMEAYLFTKGIVQGYIKIKESDYTTTPMTTTTTTTRTTTQTFTTSSSDLTTTSIKPTQSELKIDVSDITLENGGQYTIKANQTGLTYRSNDTNVAVVSKNGVITAIGEGEAVISVYNSDFDVVQLKCKVLKKGNYVYGDANIDGTVDISDAVLIMQNLSNPSKYGENGTDKAHITAKGIKYGDVSGNGDGLTNKDALAIQRYMLKLISSLPE